MESLEGGGGIVPDSDLLEEPLMEGLEDTAGDPDWVLGLEVTTGDTEVVMHGEGEMEGEGLEDMVGGFDVTTGVAVMVVVTEGEKLEESVREGPEEWERVEVTLGDVEDEKHGEGDRDVNGVVVNVP